MTRRSCRAVAHGTPKHCERGLAEANGFWIFIFSFSCFAGETSSRIGPRWKRGRGGAGGEQRSEVGSPCRDGCHQPQNAKDMRRENWDKKTAGGDTRRYTGDLRLQISVL